MTQSSEPATPTRGHLTRTLRAAARRPRPDAVLLVAIIALLNAAIYQAPLYGYAAARQDTLSFSGALTLGTLYVVVAFVTATLLALAGLVSQRLLKLTLPLSSGLLSVPIMRTSCLAAGPLSSVSQTSSG